MLYFDNAASTPPSKNAIKAMHDALDTFYANPSSLHQPGIEARKRLNQAKRHMAEMMHVDRHSIIFTSSGTEAINLAIKGVFYKNKDAAIVTTTAEHHAVSRTTEFLESIGAKVFYIDVDAYGYVDLQALEKILKNHTVSLVSIIYANNEIGALQDVNQIRELTAKYNALLHYDMVQVPLHEAINFKHVDCDLASFSAHKFYGPRGAGFLYKKTHIELTPHTHGGQHEFKLRAGTENLAAIIGMEIALEDTYKTMHTRNQTIQELASYFIEKLKQTNLDFRLNGPPMDHHRVHSILNIGFKNQDAQILSFALNQKGIYVTLGSACDSESIEPSHVLKAIAVPSDYIHGSLRFSLSETMQKKDIDNTVDVLKELIDNKIALIE